MTISEMHIYFRQLAQQMGMQNVRSILPEQIDILLNVSISDIVNKLVRENTGIRADKSTIDNFKIGQPDALKTLYKVEYIDLCPIAPNIGDIVDSRVFEFSKSMSKQGKISTIFDRSAGIPKNSLPNYLYLTDIAVNYKQCLTGYSGEHDTQSTIGYMQPTFSSTVEESQFVPISIVDNAAFANTVRDSILSPTIQHPVAVTYDNNEIDIYFGKFIKKDTTYCLYACNLIPYKLRISYIRKPAKVAFATTSVDCDLPESMHIDVIKNAVDLYFASVHKTGFNNQTMTTNTVSPTQEEA